MKKVKILGDTINKVADTSTVFYFVLLNGGQEQGVTGKTVSFTIANDSGYLFDVPAVIDGNVISLDFSNEQLKQLTPDTYHMEVYVTNGDGDVEVYPSQGAIDFRVGKNLHSTQGKLVTQITFDTVLRSVDEKIVEYTKTIAKGEKGDTGPQGPKGDMDLSQITVGGRNLYLNSRVLSDGYGVNSTATVTVEPFDSTINMWHFVAAQGSGSAVGIYLFNYGNGKINNNSDWSYSADIKGTGQPIDFGIENTSKEPVKGVIGNDWSRISQTGHVNESNIKTLVMYFDTTNSPLDVYIKLPKLETGNIATDWTPAPEDAPSNDAQLVHKTGTETIAGDKTFTGSINFSNRITSPAVIATDLLTGFHNVIQVPTTTTKIIDLINNDFINGRGFWKEATYIAFNTPLSDAPTTDAYSIIKLATRGVNRTYVEYSDLSGNVWHTTATTNSLLSWVKQANDNDVIHKTGNENAAGDKTFTGNTTLASTTILAGNYGLRVTPSGFQKTTDGRTWVAANI